METIKKYIQSAKTYLASDNGKDLVIGLAVVVGAIAIITLIVLFIQNSGPKIDYQPTIACDLLTEEKAKEMLGDKVLHQKPDSPTLSQNVATSKCSYTDQNPDQDKMLVAAVAVRSGVTDQGTDKNKREFAAAKLNQGMQEVKNVGDDAFFNPTLGQLNILKDRDWIIVSYGVGADPKSNTLDNAKKLAQKLTTSPMLPTF